MDPASPRVLLTTVVGSFHARVLEARLAAEGVGVELRGLNEGPYPVALPVDILVTTADLALAREILLADAVDAAFAEPEAPSPGERDVPPSPGHLVRRALRRRLKRREGP